MTHKAGGGTHRILDIKIPWYRAGKPAWATCDTCTVRVEVLPDPILDDPWEPLTQAWARHKGVIGRDGAVRLPRAEAEVAGGRKAAAVHRAKVGAF